MSDCLHCGSQVEEFGSQFCDDDCESKYYKELEDSYAEMQKQGA
jgi:hypothetical protein